MIGHAAGQGSFPSPEHFHVFVASEMGCKACKKNQTAQAECQLRSGPERLGMSMIFSFQSSCDAA